ncbi:hypothetical protein [Bacillus cabrialesii]|uniref:Uncharacterized protein n=1 Tax=Bacillus cabrialesii subsp. tritici TaxID=2944916 RepID=A0ABT9DKR2_9BACI|nr:hypothetical protein [Bacillus cabrialesii]MDO8225295.1 hypothetical protein [Bacillus cabrialesii subsp. tritici]RJS57256.1 hypothetical protein CJ481_15860 [Bacillus subtilis]
MNSTICKVGIVGMLSIGWLLSPFATGVEAKEEARNNQTTTLSVNQPVNVLKTASVLNSQNSKPTGDDWESAGTEYGSTKFEKYSLAAVVQTLGFALNLPSGGWSSYLAGLANMIILGEYPVVYFKDRKEFKMAGATLMTRHNVTIYEDKDRNKKIGSDSFIITDRGGPKAADK